MRRISRVGALAAGDPARVLAVDRKTLDRMIKRHHIDSDKARRGGR